MLISLAVYEGEMWLSAVEELKGFSHVCPPDNKDYRSPSGPVWYDEAYTRGITPCLISGLVELPAKQILSVSYGGTLRLENSQG